ncbi:MAG: DUF3349 domain-containing protein [Nocardioides sp.]|nr:DUF3349 domain-containing protein [Nocardioides sp.]
MDPAPDSAGSPQRDGLITRIVSWLRAGYPDGVPQQDYVALLGILRRALTPTELDRVVRALSDEVDSEHTIITRAMVEERIEDVLKGPALPEDVVRVSSRLAAAGWPLWSPEHGHSMEDSLAAESSQVRAGVVARVVEWLRTGYPTGLPRQDFIPLIALLRRRLTDAEVAGVGRGLVEQGTWPVDRVDVGTAITEVTAELPSEEDIERVRRYLTEHGWPTDFPV